MSYNHTSKETIELRVELLDGTEEKFTMTDASWDDIGFDNGMLMLRAIVNKRHAMTLIPLHRIAMMHATGDMEQDA